MSETGARAGAAERHRLLPGVIATVVAFALLVHPLLFTRVREALEETRYSHALIVPVVSLLWCWDRSDTLTRAPRSTSRAAIAAVGLCALLFVYGRLIDSRIGTLGGYVQHVAALGIVASVVWAAFGRRVLALAAFPLGYLAFTIPVPKRVDLAITLPLQRFASDVAATCFELIGWSVAQDGNVVHLPGVKLLVEEQCSGVHGLYALTALAVAWIGFFPRSRVVTVVLLLAVVPIAVVANVVRVVLTGVLAYRVDPKCAEGVSHEIAGLVVFAIGLTLFALLDWALRPERAVQDVPDGGAGNAA